MKGGDLMEWFTLITAIVNSGLADKLLAFLTQIFSLLSLATQGKVAELGAQKLLTWAEKKPV